MASNRIQKVNAFLQAELAQLIENVLRDKKTGLVTVTRIDTSPDMGNSRVWLSILGSIVPDHKVIEMLNKKSGYIHKQIWSKMSAKKVPRLEFRLDQNADYVEKIENILEEIKEK